MSMKCEYPVQQLRDRVQAVLGRATLLYGTVTWYDERGIPRLTMKVGNEGLTWGANLQKAARGTTDEVLERITAQSIGLLCSPDTGGSCSVL